MKSIKLAFILIVASLAASSCASQKGSVPVVTISTSKGDIALILSDKTPLHRDNFLKLTKEGYYNGTTFHRVIAGFMIQGGDPNSKNSDPNDDGQGGPGYTTAAEFDPSLTHVQGALAAARMGDNVNPQKESSGSQFYIVENPNGTHFLDKGYTVFGQVIKGLDVVSAIAAAPKNGSDRPNDDIKMTVTVKQLKAKKLKQLYNYEAPATK